MIDIQTSNENIDGSAKANLLFKRMQTTNSNLFNMRREDNIHSFMDGSMNESHLNFKTDLNMFTFGSENIRIAQEEEDDLYE